MKFYFKNHEVYIAMINLYTPKAEKAVARLLGQLNPGKKLREVIGKQSEINLRCLNTWHTTPAKAFLKNLLGIESSAVPITKIIVPEAIGEPQNKEILYRLKDKKFVIDLIDDSGVLDLRKAGLRRKPGYRDLTLGFEDVQLLKELRGSLEPENIEAYRKDGEIRSLVLFHDLWRARTLLYQAEEHRAAALKEGNNTLYCENQAIMIRAANYLEELANNFYFDGLFESIRSSMKPLKTSVSDKIKMAAGFIRKGPYVAGNAILVAICTRLSKEIKTLESQRILQFFRSKTQRPENPLEEEIRNLAKRRYKISFFSNGLWIIPQRGFRRAGRILQRQPIEHNVPEDKVSRRIQHIIDSITEQISKNSNFIAMLNGFADLFNSGAGLNLEQVQNELAAAFVNYEKGIVSEKFRAKLMLKLAFELINSARIYSNDKAQRRAVKFAADMCEMAAQEIFCLNQNLSEQLPKIVSKNEVLMEVIAERLVQENNLRTISENLLGALVKAEMMNSGQRVNNLRNFLKDAYRALQTDANTSKGILRAQKRIIAVYGDLSRLDKNIFAKEKCRDAIVKARSMFKLLAKNMPADKVEALKQNAIENARENLANIVQLDAQQISRLKHAIDEALLIQNDLERKYEDEKPEQQKEYLMQHKEVFAEFNRIGLKYLSVVDARGNVIGQALPYDVKELNLKTR